MRNQWHIFVKAFSLTYLALLLTTACNSSITQSSGISAERLVDNNCRVFLHKFGETCVPSNPQRIVTLDDAYILDPLLAVGVRPVGSSTSAPGIFWGVPTNAVAGIEVVGLVGQPSIEKILTLKPDLILSHDFYSNYVYNQLSTIAPTLPIDVVKARLSFKENFRFIAKLVDRETAAEEVLAKYQKRIEQLRKDLRNQLKQKEVSVIVHTGADNFLLPHSRVIYFQILNDLGIRFNSVSSKQDDFTSVNAEVLSEYDADILFIISANSKSSRLLQTPLMTSLKSVKNNRAYVVEQSIWFCYGPLGVSRLLDELSNYLLS